jgi:hypothetical protein
MVAGVPAGRRPAGGWDQRSGRGGSLLVFPALLAVGFRRWRPTSPLGRAVADTSGSSSAPAGPAQASAGASCSPRRVAVVGSAVGCVLLLVLPAAVFDAVVPALVLLASALMALQPRIKKWIGAPEPGAPDRSAALLPAVFSPPSTAATSAARSGSILIAALSAVRTNDTCVRNSTRSKAPLSADRRHGGRCSSSQVRGPVDGLAVANPARRTTTLVGGFIVRSRARPPLPETRCACGRVLGLAVGITCWSPGGGGGRLSSSSRRAAARRCSPRPSPRPGVTAEAVGAVPAAALGRRPPGSSGPTSALAESSSSLGVHAAGGPVSRPYQLLVHHLQVELHSRRPTAPETPKTSAAPTGSRWRTPTSDLTHLHAATPRLRRRPGAAGEIENRSGQDWAGAPRLLGLHYVQPLLPRHPGQRVTPGAAPPPHRGALAEVGVECSAEDAR